MLLRDERGLLLGGTRRTSDLHDVALLLLGTGMRIGEALALEWTEVDLDGNIPHARVAATMVEPRRDAATGQVFVAGLHRQPMTKTGATRSIALPHVVVEMLHRRRAGTPGAARIAIRSSPTRAEAGCGRTTCGPSCAAWSRARRWSESAHTRYVAR